MSTKKALFFVVTLVILALLVRGYFFTTYRVATGYMKPTLLPGDIVLAQKLKVFQALSKVMDPPFRLSEPLKRGDLVVYQDVTQENKLHVKKIVGLPGDRIEWQEGRLLVNEHPYKDSFMVTDSEDKRPKGLALVGQNQYLLMSNKLPPSQEKELLATGGWQLVFQSQIQARVLVVGVSIDLEKMGANTFWPHFRQNRFLWRW